jgi:excisionase family DNA binding protein
MKKLPTLPPDCRERLLNTHEIAARLLIQSRTAALWARQGRLPAYRLGRLLRFKWDEVERALAATCRVNSNKS